jgi:CelD/BcsL family acetyltransferase involved in cellulose biosynthesis
MLVGWSGYASLAIPTLDRCDALQAAGGLIDAARKSGARALWLPGLAVDGAAYAALDLALKERGLSAEILRRYRRAALDCTSEADATLREALGAKKLKELRRQRHRLEDTGALSLSIARTPQDVAAALEEFLVLEAKGWKGARGTALIQHDGDALFIRNAATALAAQGRFEIASLTRDGTAIASGLILRDGDRAYFFKIAMDESEARASPGVQLTLDITRHLCADPNVAFADSSADGEHPMIDHVWRRRIEIADVFIALSPRDPLATALRFLVKARNRTIELVRTIRRIREKLS